MNTRARFHPSIFACLVVVGLASFAAPLDAQTSREDAAAKSRQAQLEADLRKRTLQLRKEQCESLDKISEWAAKNGLKDDAIAIYKRIKKIDRDYEDLEDLRKKIKKSKRAKESDKLASLRDSLAEKLKKADEGHASDLYRFALQCFKFGLFSRSYDLLGQVVELAPDPKSREQKKARAVLGYTWDRKEERWLTNWEAAQRKKHFLTKAGWVENKNRKKWDQGLRLYKGKWVSIDREREIRQRNEYNPYRVEGETFIVKTNLGREQAWTYAVLLEDFNRAFYRFFIGYYDQISGAKLLFKKGKLAKKYEVFVFPTHEDYLIHIKGEQGNDKLLRESAGFYSHSQKMSRFYWSDNMEDTLGTLYHEIAHQLFAETKENHSGGSQGNNWVVEGIASYVETWQKVDGTWYPGRDKKHSRLQHAKQYTDSQSKPFLRAYMNMGHKKFHAEGRRLHYALGCALCHFFLHYDDEVYKEDFTRFLSDYYGGKVKEDSILEYLAVSGYDELEKQFRGYMGGL